MKHSAIGSLVSLACVTLMSSYVQADDLRVLPESRDKIPSALYADLLRQAEAAIQRRTESLEKIKTVDEARQWQRQRREMFLRILGPLPERSPLNARVVGTLRGDDYRVEKVVYESRPGHHITGALYVPEGKGPFPAVLVPCGHSFNGKAADAYQRVSILMAKNGIAALCYDPIGQGERYQTYAGGQGLGAGYKGSPSSVKQLERIALRPNFNPVEEHTLIGIGSILVGLNTATYRVWDGMRTIDYLASRPDIDPKRIGCTGNSGGGTLTAYLMALDDRIACGAPGCAITSFRRLLQTAGPQDAEQNLYSQLAMGLDEADFLHLRTPKPTVLLAGTRDTTFDIVGTWEVFREAKRFYARFEHPERVDLVEADAPHGFTPQLRVGAVRWMRRWLLGKDDAITEPDFKVWTNEDLYCTPKGQVMLLPGEKSVFDFNRERDVDLAKRRAAVWKTTPTGKLIEQVRTVVGVRPLKDLPPLRHRLVDTVKRDGYVIEKMVLSGESGVELPALAFVPPDASGEAYLYLHGEGKQTDSAPGGPIEAIVRRGHVVLAVDLRGQGELYRRHPRDWGGSLFGPNCQEFFLAYLLGKSLVGQWTEDALGAGRFLASYRSKDTPRKLHLVGIGAAGVPALHAAALERQFASVTLRRSLRAWAEVLRAPTVGNLLPLTVHAALETYDLPDLVRVLGDTVKVVDPLDLLKSRP